MLLVGLWVVAAALLRASGPFPPLTIDMLYASGAAAPGMSVRNDDFAPFLNMIPSSDGTEIVVSAAGGGEVGGVLFANFLDIGPGGRKHSYTMVYSDTAQTYYATAVGFTAGVDASSTVNVTSTLGLKSGDVQVQRVFITPSETESVSVNGGAFGVEMPNIGSVAADTYLAVLSTNAPPGSLPSGYRFASSTYALNPSGALTQTEKLMTLVFNYTNTLPTGVHPHTLAVVGWNYAARAWEVLDGDLLVQRQEVQYVTRRFGIYALAATPIWRDSFDESTLSGVSDQQNIHRRSDGTIILDNGATTGSLTSIPITLPADAVGWGTLRVSSTIPPNTELRIDLLDAASQVVRADLADGADLSGLALTDYPSLKLRATLTTTQVGISPELHSWQVSWVPSEQQGQRTYLPLMVR